jgi:HEAT repeat protein
MQGLTDLFWRPIPDVRMQERPRFLFFAALATAISLAQTLGLTGAEALFMAELGARYLPVTIIGGSLATVIVFVAYAARVGDARNDNLFIQMLIGAGVVLIGATAGLSLDLRGVSIFLICFFFVTQAIFVNHLWTFTTDYFDTVTSKRLLPLFTIGASVGGVIGGLLAAGISGVMGPNSLIAGWALFLFAAAVLIRVGRSRLRGWGPIGVEEADETSVEGIRGAVRFMRVSTLGRALLVSAVGMILALVVARYMWLDAFAQRFPDPAELAWFIGLFLAATNVIEIVIEMVITPWLIRNAGVPSANLVHPVLTLLSFGGLAFQYNIVSGAIARMNGEMLENALANPIRALLCNAIPMRFRGRVRAFLEGIVVYAGMSIGGGVLWLLGNPDPLLLALAGASASAIYLIANVLVRREYMRTLISELTAGRLDLADLGEEVGSWEAARLAELWETLISQEDERPSRSLLIPTLVSSLDDADHRVRLAAMRGLMQLGDEALTEERTRELVHDPDPLIRAEAARRAGAEFLVALEEMIASPDANESIAALTTAPPQLLEAAKRRVFDADPEVRAAALECLARIATELPIEFDEVCEALANADHRVRRAAILLLANYDGDDAIEALASAMADPSNEVQFAAESVLSSLGDESTEAVIGYLEGQAERTVSCALRVVARCCPEDSTAILHRALRSRIRELWYWVIASERLRSGEGLANRFLLAAYSDGVARNQRLAFRILELLEGSDIVRNVEKALRFGSVRSLGDALEVLSHLGDRTSTHLLVTFLHESSPLEDRIEAVRKFISVPDEPQKLIAASRLSQARWIRMAAQACDSPPGESQEEEIMERLLALKEISLFKDLSLDQLEAVHQITTEEEYLPGEVIVQQGDRGDQLYLLLAGRVRVFKNHKSPNEEHLRDLTSGSYFGEMAILGGGERLATIVTLEHSHLVSLDGNSLRELLMHMPEISFEIFRVLVDRVRAAEG